MSNTWRQVRIFTANFGPGWYHELLVDVVMPCLVQHAKARYFFSKYLVNLGGIDDNDTDRAQLQQQQAFLQATPQGLLHRSLRVRFVELRAHAAIAAPAAQPAPAVPPPYQPGPVEVLLRNQIQAHPQRFWFSSFLDYGVANDLGGDRFSPFPVGMVRKREERGEIVASVLHANCHLVLQLFAVNGQEIAIERSAHGMNAVLGTPVQSVAHMLANVWFNHAGESAQIWALDLDRNLGGKV